MKSKIIWGTALLLYSIIMIDNVNSQSITIERYDIVVSEIMADPTPPIGLPAVEYFELHNRLPVPCHLQNWTIRIGNSTKDLPAITLDSMGYALVIAEKYREDYAESVPNLYTISSLSLTDAGQTLILYNADNEVVHTVSYRKSWHEEPVKQEGGWSLEMIDEALPNAGQDNWASSVSPLGGTPGLPNSVAASIGDGIPPEMERVTMIDSVTLRVFFSEPVCPDLPIPSELFSIDPNIPIFSVNEVPPFFNALNLHLSESPIPGRIHRLALSGSLPDYAGNETPTNSTIPFGIPSHPGPKDLLINEVLTHPFSGTEADFIELFNKSSHIIDLKDVKIGSNGDTIPQKAVVAVSSGMQLMPGDLCALCKNKRQTTDQYYCPAWRQLVQCDSLPAYAASEGVVFVTDIALRTIDRLQYTEDMHYPHLVSTEGVSLERLSTDRPTQDADNWYSASFTVGYATPGYANSQHLEEIADAELGIYPDVISPNNDGFNDYAEICLNFPTPENRVTINIFNNRGCLVNHLVNNELCGNDACFRWEGLDDNMCRLPSGIYVALIQYWNEQGKSRRMRKTISIARW